MSLATGNDLAVTFGAHDVFSGVGFEIPDRARIALIGPNGSGKTSLLRLIAGLDRPIGDGRIHRKRGLSMGYLPQEPDLPSGRTLYAEMRGVFGALDAQADELRRLEAAMADAAKGDEVLVRYERLQAAYETAGGYLIDNQIQRVLTGLGFDADDFERPLGQLSGGQRTRALLGRLLLESPDLLLLDEPTNHLDVEAIEWLEGYFRDWDGALVAVAHDRAFLDNVAQRVWEMDAGQLTTYRGNYSHYVAQRAERLANQAKARARQQAFIAKEEDFIQRNLAGQRTKEAQGRRKRLRRMARLDGPAPAASPAQVRLESGGRSGDKVVRLIDLTVGYDPGKPLLYCDDVELQWQHTVALVGPNGAGKTTLLRTLLGEVSPLAGEARLGGGVRVGYYSQTHERLASDRTVLDHILEASTMTIPEARGFLGRYRFSGDDVFKPVATLSGGERARVSLALLELDGANLLILDEPTNHLDVLSQEMLQEAIGDFDGTTLLVTHDRYLIRGLEGEVWAIESGRLWHFVEGYDAYHAWLEGRRAGDTDAGKEARRQEYMAEKRASRQAERDIRKRDEHRATLEAAVAALEARIEVLATEIEAASARQQVETVMRLGDEYAEAEATLEARLAEWLALEETEPGDEAGMESPD